MSEKKEVIINEIDLTSRPSEEPVFQKQSSMNSNSSSARILHKLEIRKKVESISSGDWLLTQEILQDIQANILSIDPKAKMPNNSQLRDLLLKEIEQRYKDEEELRTLLLESIPTLPRIKAWVENDKWEEAVWAKIRNCHLFNKENRYKVIDSLMKKALSGDTSASKIWLTLSGDYSEKTDLQLDKRIEAFREINEILHSKKNS